jgi:hypothetical protein
MTRHDHAHRQRAHNLTDLDQRDDAPRLADGPDEVHKNALARTELNR